jgi:SAM-dependent methyltransferase
MIERPKTSSYEETEQIADIYLRNLALEWNELKDKKVLDIGAMNAAFESAARRRGVDVTSVDKDLIEGDYAPLKDSKYVIARATKLPFADETFDYALAHTSVMNYIEEKYDFDTEYEKYLEDALHEAARVLKPGGQFRFTRTLLDEQELREGDEMVPESKTEAYAAWLAEREHKFLEAVAIRSGFKELQVIRYTGEQLERTKADYGNAMGHFFVALK